MIEAPTFSELHLPPELTVRIARLPGRLGGFQKEHSSEPTIEGAMMLVSGRVWKTPIPHLFSFPKICGTRMNQVSSYSLLVTRYIGNWGMLVSGRVSSLHPSNLRMSSLGCPVGSWDQWLVNGYNTTYLKMVYIGVLQSIS